MSVNAEKILQEALKLPPQDRAEVLERLLATFQQPPDCKQVSCQNALKSPVEKSALFSYILYSLWELSRPTQEPLWR